ncbi:cadherin-like domain-containing protein [Pseudomonas sp. NyZ704]|nr:cadherin-like domain-containing protein [Pseudomonas sp. NyZ704]
MITVKGTKNASPETDTSQRYVQKSGDETSRTPHAISALLMGVTAYLTSIFAWGPERAPRPTSEQPIAAAAEPPSPADMADGMASSRKSHDVADSEPPNSETSSVDDAPRSTSLSNPDESEGVLLAGRPTSGNSNAEIPDRGGRPAGTSLANDDPALGGGGSSGADSPPVDDLPAEGADPTDGGDPTDDGEPLDGDPLNPDIDDADCVDRSDQNRAPRVSGPVYLLDVAPCTALLIALDDLLGKAYDPDGDVLSVENLAVSSGTLTEVDGGWVFQSDMGQLGPVTLTYQISDGELTTDAVARFSVVEQPVIVGTAANDALLGSLCADEIDGADGDDNIDGRAGDDVLAGGAGDDHIVAGDGDDVVFGGDGNDIIFGGAGNDHLFGGDGDDRLFGDDGDDVIFGNAGEDRLSGGDGNDLLFGGDGADFLYGDAGDDTLAGGEGDDRLYGGAGQDVIDGGDGNDVIMDGAGRDQVFGGMGSDRVVAALDADDDVYDGGADSDTLDYSSAWEGIVVDLVNGVASGVEIGRDAITGFEKVLGGRGDDLFILGSEPVALTGGAGDDVFAFDIIGGDRPNAVSHVILDFGVGDRIRMSEYDIFSKADDDADDRFERIYQSNGDHDLPIRYRHDRDEGLDWTVIETDFEADEAWAAAITLQGTHTLLWSKERDDGLEWLS